MRNCADLGRGDDSQRLLVRHEAEEAHAIVAQSERRGARSKQGLVATGADHGEANSLALVAQQPDGFHQLAYAAWNLEDAEVDELDQACLAVDSRYVSRRAPY